MQEQFPGFGGRHETQSVFRGQLPLGRFAGECGVVGRRFRDLFDRCRLPVDWRKFAVLWGKRKTVYRLEHMTGAEGSRTMGDAIFKNGSDRFGVSGVKFASSRVIDARGLVLGALV